MAELGTVFLMYHELAFPGRALCHREPGYSRYVVAASNFRSQMESFAHQGWRGKNVSQAIEAFQSNSVGITFDDGCETDLLLSAPVLKEFEFGATFYITVGFLGKPGYLSEAQVRNLSRLGFEIGCHSLNHPYLTDLDNSRLYEETAGAKARLEQVAGVPVEHFSCPGGRWNPSVAAAVKAAGYRTMATSRIGINSASSDRFALARIAVLEGTTVEELIHACSGHGLLWAQFQERARDAAKRLLGNSSYESLRSLILGREQRPNRNQQ